MSAEHTRIGAKGLKVVEASYIKAITIEINLQKARNMQQKKLP